MQDGDFILDIHWSILCYVYVVLCISCAMGFIEIYGLYKLVWINPKFQYIY